VIRAILSHGLHKAGTPQSLSLLIIDTPPLHCVHISELPDRLVRPHHLLVTVITEDEMSSLKIGLDCIREQSWPTASMYTALRSSRFYRDWLVIWGSRQEFAKKGFLAQPGQVVTTMVADGEHIVSRRQAKRGTYPYSTLERLVQTVLAAHIYRCSRLLGGAIAANEGVAAGEPGAASVITSLLLPLRSVLRSGKRNMAEDWAGNLYSELRNDIGPPFVRALYGEKPRTAELDVGASWFALGSELANKQPLYEDVEHQLPEIADELTLLDKIIGLRMRVARMANGERSLNTSLGGAEAIPFELAEPILWDSDTTGRPGVQDMTKIAYWYNFDASQLYPEQAYLRPHFLAAAAVGKHERTGAFDEDPSAHWGLLGLIEEREENGMGPELVAARAFLRARLGADLQQWVLRKEPGPILRPLDILEVRKFMAEQEKLRG